MNYIHITNKPNPWLMVLQGILIFSIGIFILTRPEVTLVVLTRLLGIILLVAGGILMFSANYKRATTNQLILIEGAISIGLGLLFTLFPQSLANVFIIILGIITFLSGLINLWLLIKVRIRITSPAFIRNGLLLLFGIFLLANPMEGQEAIAVIIGIFAIVFGIIFLYGAYKLFKTKKQK
jgi:uncharacterized membrane protein HdeD (DUF308 family)